MSEAPSNLADRASALLEAGAFAQAAALAEQGVGLTPEDPGLWGLYGIALVASGRLGDGLEALQRSATLAPENPEPVSNLVKVFIAISAWAQADRAADTLLRLAPDDADALRLAAQVKTALGDQASADALLQRAGPA